MLLDLSQSCPRDGLDQDLFRQLIYLRHLDENHFYTPRETLLPVARRWRIYQAREYFSYVFNRLLRWVSRRGLEATDEGMTLVPEERLRELIAAALNEGPTSNTESDLIAAASADTSVLSFLARLRKEVPLEAGIDEAWPAAEVDEHALYWLCRDRDDDDGLTLKALVAMLLLLRERFGLPARIPANDEDLRLLAAGGGQRIGMAGFMHQLNQMLMSEPTFAELLTWLVGDFVIAQHERVAAAKLPDDTYRVRRVGTALRFMPRECAAGFNDSRFTALSTTVHELGWVSTFREPNRELSPAGRRLLDAGDLSSDALLRGAKPFLRTPSESA